MIGKIPLLFLFIVAYSFSCSNQDVKQQAITICSTPVITSVGNFEELSIVNPNNLLHAGGTNNDNITSIHLIADAAVWRPENEGGPEVKVYAFNEKNCAPQIPGPLIRVRQGEKLKITIENRIKPGEFIGIPPANRRYENMETTTQSELIIHGIKLANNDTSEVRIPFGETLVLEYTATEIGRFIYWGSTSDQPMFSRTGIDAQLTGLLVVDPINVEPFPGERLFLITMTDAFLDSVSTGPGTGIFELAINGLSWPHTERLRYPIYETQRWNWFNGTGFEHPMHLHGFHFRTLERMDRWHRQIPNKDEIREVVTELMEPGSSFLMEWTPTRMGNWLMHCHIVDHVIPDPPRSFEERNHDHDDLSRHPLDAMAGLIMGITVKESKEVQSNSDIAQHLHLVARQKSTIDGQTPLRGYALETEDFGSEGVFSSPGPPVILTKGELTKISIFNHIDQGTAVHWHGMELQSYYDGIPGWSGSNKKLAPIIDPGESFDAFINPPRAGTFIYHTHMDETDQLRSGLYGPLIVINPGEQYDEETDKIILIGDAVNASTGEYEGVTVNGSNNPEPLIFNVGETYRLRFIDIGETSTVDVIFEGGGEILEWQALAKDGATLPILLQVNSEARLKMGTGETYDFLFKPTMQMNAEIVVNWHFPTFVGNKIVRVPVFVR